MYPTMFYVPFFMILAFSMAIAIKIFLIRKNRAIIKRKITTLKLIKCMMVLVLALMSFLKVCTNQILIQYIISFCILGRNNRRSATKNQRKKENQILLQLGLIVGSFLMGYVPITSQNIFIYIWCKIYFTKMIFSTFAKRNMMQF